MEAFVTAADKGSFAAAATALGLSAQAIGKQIAALEQRIGGRLLNRTTRRQSLTELGQTFYERCRQVLAEADAAEALAQDLVARPRGRLRISAPVALGTYQLMPLVSRYLTQHPEVSVEVVLTDRYVDLVGEGFEAAIRIGPLPDTSLVARKLPSFRLVACAAPSYLDARGRPSHPAELTRHDCLGYVFSTKPPLREWRLERNGEAVAVAVSSRLEVNNADALVTAAVNGSGIILLSEPVLAHHLAFDRLERVLPGWHGPPRPLHVMFAPDRRLTPKLRAFIDLVVAGLSN